MVVGPICEFSVVGGLVVRFWEGGFRWLVDLCCFGMKIGLSVTKFCLCHFTWDQPSG